MASMYDNCKHIKRTQPDPHVSEELIKEIALNFRTLPTFETSVFENIHTKHYSLQSNELLKCRWHEYRQHIDERVFKAFQFPNHRDLHFHNGNIRFMPSISIFRRTDFRAKLKPGPGVDYRGQMPIPQELMMKRLKVEKTDKKTVKKDKNKDGNNKEKKRN